MLKRYRTYSDRKACFRICIAFNIVFVTVKMTSYSVIYMNVMNSPGDINQLSPFGLTRFLV